MEFTELTAMSIGRVRDANRIFGKQNADKKIPIVLRPGRSAILPFLTIPEGMYALVQDHGRDINHPATSSAVWPAGMHFAAPWIKVSHLVTKQRIVFTTPVKGCKTADDVTVEIDMTIVFRIMGDANLGEDPEIVRKFVYNMGPASLQQQLADAQEEAARQLARSVPHDSVYGLRSSPTGIDTSTLKKEPLDPATVDENDAANNSNVMDEADDDYVPAHEDPEEIKRSRQRAIEHTENMKRTLNEQFNQYGVEITSVAITDVKLPKSFAEQMQEKTTYASVTAAQKMKQKNDMQLLRYNEEMEIVLQKKKEEQMAEESRGLQACALIEKEVVTTQAMTRSQIAIINEQEKTELRSIMAASELEVQKLQSETNAILKNLEAESESTAKEIQANTLARMEQINADANLQVAKNEAECGKLLGDAHGDANPKLRSKRDFDLMNKQLEIYSALSENKELVIASGGPSPNQEEDSDGKGASSSFLADLLVAQKQSNILLNIK